jgi:hypothetical protein
VNHGGSAVEGEPFRASGKIGARLRGEAFPPRGKIERPSRVETVILAALASRCGLWIRYGCQATTGTGSSKQDRGSAGC